MNFSNRPAFGRAVFRAGIQAENRPVNFLQPEFFFHRLNFFRRDEQLRRERLRVRAERGGQMQILVDLVRCRKAGAICGFERARQFMDFRNRTLLHFHRSSARRDGLRQKKIPPRARVADALRNSRKKNFQRRARRIGQHEREIKFPTRSFLPMEKTFSPGAKEIVSFTAG